MQTDTRIATTGSKTKGNNHGIYRTLRDGGHFLIVNEADGEDNSTRKWEKMVGGMKTYNREQLTDALKAVGFSKVESYHHESKPWIAVLAEK